jgi:hypothetical protein
MKIPDSDEVLRYLSRFPNSVLAAAHALADALAVHEGRRIHIDRWRPVVGAVLEKKRVRDEPFEAVLKVGQEAGLFQIDRESGAYPFFVLPEADPVVPIEEQVDEVVLPTPEEVKAFLDVHPNPYEAAALALHQAVRRYTGRRLHIDRWRPVVGTVLGRKQVRDVVYDPVLQTAERMGLLTVDRESGAYPFFVWHMPPLEREVQESGEESEEPEDPFDEEWERHVHCSEDPQLVLSPSPFGPEPPAPWNYPDYMPCGHLNFTCTETECRRPKNQPNYRFLSGVYRVPVPVFLRQTKEKITQGGFIGLVVDEDGYYCGGEFNQSPKRRKRRAP